MDIEYFHAWLRQKLYVRSAELRARFSNRLPTARELDNVVSLEMLSSDSVIPSFFKLGVSALRVRSQVAKVCHADVFPRAKRRSGLG